MTPFIVMEVLERAQQMEQQGTHIIHLEVGEPDFDMPACVAHIEIGFAHFEVIINFIETINTLRFIGRNL